MGNKNIGNTLSRDIDGRNVMVYRLKKKSLKFSDYLWLVLRWQKLQTGCAAR